jgi:hypothetical protein
MSSSSSPFYDGMFTEAEKIKVQRSPLWPILLSVHHAFGRRVLITSYRMIGGNHQAILGTHYGVNIFCTRLYGTTYTFHRYQIQTGGDAQLYQMLESTKSKYLLSRINKKKDNYEHEISREGGALMCAIINPVAAYARHVCPSQHNYQSFGVDGEYWALKLLNGKVPIDDVPITVRDKWQNTAKAFNAQDSKYKSGQKKITELLGTKKWFVCRIPSVGFMVGSILTEPLIKCCEKFGSVTGDGYSAGFNGKNPADIIKLIDPPRLHKDLSTVDPDLLGSLTLCKLARESSGMKYNTLNDTNGYMVVGDNAAFEDTGSMAWSTCDDQWFMCDKH